MKNQTLLLAALLSTLVPAAARADADPRCRAVPDCAETFAPYAKLFEAKWDMDRYRAFLARYDEKSPERRYAAAGDAPAAPKSEAEWYDKWAWRLPKNPKPWTLDYESFRAELDGYATGFALAQRRFGALASAATAKDLEHGMRAAAKGAFPGDMDRAKLSTLDVIYIYLGAERKDYLLGKLAQLKKKGDAPPKLGALTEAASFLSAGAPAAGPVPVTAAAGAGPECGASEDAVADAPKAPAAAKPAAAVPLKSDLAKRYEGQDLSARTGSHYTAPTVTLLADWAALRGATGAGDAAAREAISKELVLRWAADEMSARRSRWLASRPQMKAFLASLPEAPKLERRGREIRGTQASAQPAEPVEAKPAPARPAPARAAAKRPAFPVSRKIVEPPPPSAGAAPETYCWQSPLGGPKVCGPVVNNPKKSAPVALGHQTPFVRSLFPYGSKSLSDFFTTPAR